MNIFLDTSSLIKMYHNEADSPWLLDFIENNDIESIFLAEITRIEFLSAVWKKCRSDELSENESIALIKTFQTEVNFSFVKDSRILKRVATELISTYWREGLRTLDALQLSSALLIQDDIDYFISSDKVLNKIAETEGFKIQSIN